MRNIAAVLKEEVARLARREVRAETDKLRKASAQYRAHIAELKRQLLELRKEVARLARGTGAATQPAAPDIDATKVRWSPARLKRHRQRLDLSAERFGKLFGVTGQTVFNWEGGMRPGREHLVRIAHLRHISKRQAHALV